MLDVNGKPLLGGPVAHHAVSAPVPDLSCASLRTLLIAARQSRPRLRNAGPQAGAHGARKLGPHAPIRAEMEHRCVAFLARVEWMETAQVRNQMSPSLAWTRVDVVGRWAHGRCVARLAELATSIA